MGVLENVPFPYAEPFFSNRELSLRQTALRDLRRQHAYLLSNLPGVVYRCEAAIPWRMLFISDKVAELTGHCSEEFEAGFEWGSIVHPDDLPKLELTVERAVQGTQEFMAVYRILHKSGATKWVREQAQVAISESGEILLEGFVEDITRERELEETVRLAEKAASRRTKVLEEVLRSTNDCVYSLDRWWRISYVNPKTQEYFGEGVSLIGRPILEVFTDPESPFQDALERAMNLRERSTVQGYLPSRQRWYELTVAPTPGGITVFFRDTTEQQILREQERASADRWRNTLNAIPQMVWSMAAGGRQPDFYNDRWYEFTGLPAGSLGGVEWANLYHPDDREETLSRWRRARQNGERYEAEYRVRDRYGNYRWVISRGHAELDEHGNVARWYGTCTDVHERHLDQMALKESERLSRGIVEATPDCMSVLDSAGTVLYVNSAAANAYGERDASALVGRSWGSAFRGPKALEAQNALREAKRGEVGRLTLKGGASGDRWYDVAVAPIFSAEGAPSNFLISSRDFTERKLAEEKAQWAANHDSLTGLPNRFLFHNRLMNEINKAGDGTGFTLLIFDVDYLKNINDGLGHDAGDALLREVAMRVASQLRSGDIVARLGGDEFGVLLADVTDHENIHAVVRAIRERLAQPFTYCGKLIDCQGSIGASIFPLHAEERSELMKCADVALYAAKQSAKGQLRVYDPAMRDLAQRRLSMLSLARSALGHGSIVPFYQPKVGLADGRVHGFEALLRWRDRSGKIQYPRSISAAFEDAELASQISDRMIETALKDVRLWLDEGTPFGHVALNAGFAELRRQDFVEMLLGNLASKNIPTNCIQLEVTETVFLGRGSDYIEQALSMLNKAGVKLALDDFGTGYASLSHLNTYPVDYIKIDRSFVEDIGTEKGGQAIVEAVIGLGRSLGMEIIAEGIETARQHQFLSGLNCQYAQGFYYSKAVPAVEVPEVISRLKVH